jgi:hypothetical protein
MKIFHCMTWLGRLHSSDVGHMHETAAAERLDAACDSTVEEPHVEQGYKQLKVEVGLDEFERRSWPGFHHHATLCLLAYGFLQLERLRGTPTLLDVSVELKPAALFEPRSGSTHTPASTEVAPIRRAATIAGVSVPIGLPRVQGPVGPLLRLHITT